MPGSSAHRDLRFRDAEARFGRRAFEPRRARCRASAAAARGAILDGVRSLAGVHLAEVAHDGRAGAAPGAGQRVRGRARAPGAAAVRWSGALLGERRRGLVVREDPREIAPSAERPGVGPPLADHLVDGRERAPGHDGCRDDHPGADVPVDGEPGAPGEDGRLQCKAQRLRCARERAGAIGRADLRIQRAPARRSPPRCDGAEHPQRAHGLVVGAKCPLDAFGFS